MALKCQLHTCGLYNRCWHSVSTKNTIKHSTQNDTSYRANPSLAKSCNRIIYPKDMFN